MNQDEMTLALFLASRMKEKNISIKKLSELTGIAPVHIENILRGDFEDLPSAPYFRGYLIHLGKVLDFDGEEWWRKAKEEGGIKNSGPEDSLPRNRFMKKSWPKWVWPLIVLGVIIVLYLAFELPHALGKPSLSITNPTQNPFTTSSSTIVIQGIVSNADSLELNGAAVAVNPDGSWSENVLLQDGLNTFQISAKKLLGRETDVVEQVLYQAPVSTTPSSTATSTLPAGTGAGNGSGTGTTSTGSIF